MDKFSKEDMDWMTQVANESVMDMVNVLRVHKREDLIHDDQMREILGDVYRAGMIKALDIARKENEKKSQR